MGLASAEAWAFTGAEAEGRLVYAPIGVDISHSAFLRHCLALEAHGNSLDDLVAAIRAADIRYERFHITIMRPPPKQEVHGPSVVLAAANAITGRPDLTAPQVRLAVVVTAQHWYLGRIVAEGENRWREGMHRPHHFSSALPQRMSRALANLVAGPGQTLIDPCCGIGTVVMEAAEAGIIAFGADQNGPMLKLVATNLAHFGLPCRLFRADATRLSGHFDGAVLDLPYGRNTYGNLALWRQLMAPLRAAANRIVVVAPRDLGDLTTELGLRLVRKIVVPKGGLTRHIHLLTPARQKEER